MHAALAQSEPALRGYMALTDMLNKSSLTALERQVVLLETNRFNEAPYCMTGHSAIAHALGMPPDWLAALRDGEPLPDRRVEALRRFAFALLEGRGSASEEEWAAFHAAGYANEQALDVVLALTLKTLSNFTSRMGALPLDVGHQPWAWSPAGEKDKRPEERPASGPEVVETADQPPPLTA